MASEKFWTELIEDINNMSTADFLDFVCESDNGSEIPLEIPLLKVNYIFSRTTCCDEEQSVYEFTPSANEVAYNMEVEALVA